MPEFADLFSGLTWLAVENTSGEEIPAFAVMRVSGMTTTGAIQVAKPNADSLQGCLVNGEGIIPAPVGGVNGRGHGTAEGACFALYDAADGAPAALQAWGAGNASWKLRKGKTGFIVYGGAANGRVLVVRGCL